MAVESSVSLSVGLNLSLELVDREVVNRQTVMSNLQLDQQLGVDHLAVDLPVVLATVVTNSWAIGVIYRNYRVSKRKQTRRKHICVMLYTFFGCFYQIFFNTFLQKALKHKVVSKGKWDSLPLFSIRYINSCKGF